MVIVTSSAMRSAAETLANHREQGYGLDVEVVTIDQVYNEFSSGQADLSAVEFYANALQRCEPRGTPKYLLLLGDASFDPKPRERRRETSCHRGRSLVLYKPMQQMTFMDS